MIDTTDPILDSVFSALSHTKRRAMFYSLTFRPSTVQQLAREQQLSLPAIHKHIRALEAAGLIVRKKSGRVNYVTINRIRLKEVQHWFGQFNTEVGTDQQTLENYMYMMQKSINYHS